MKGNAVLFSEMTPAGGSEAAFKTWYGEQHGPGVPYKSEAGPHYLAVFELDSADAATAPDVPASMSGVTRYVAAEASFRAREDTPADPLDAAVVHCMFFNVPMERSTVFEKWFDGEHAAMLLECPDWVAVRRLDVLDWDPHPASHMILHYLNDGRALQSDAVAKARATEQYNRLAAEPWFTPLAVTYCVLGK